MPPLLSSSDSEDDAPIPPKGFAINEVYAKRLEHNKAREELHRLQAKYPGIKTHAAAAEDEGEEDDSSTSESEDEVGELVTPHVDAQIWRTLAMLREGAPEVYDENWKGFDDEDEGDQEHVTKEKKEKPMYLKDYHRKTLLAGAEEDETPRAVRTYAEEEQALKDAFHTSLPTSDNEQDDLIKPKPKNKSSKDTEEQEYQTFLSESLQDPSSQKLLQQLQSLASTTTTTTATTLETEDGEAFLAKYLLNRGWLETPTTTTEQPELYEDNSSDEEKVETFETKYNFRFEAPGAGEVTTHARTLATTRRGDEKRKRERERKRTAKEEEKRKEMEEIARLRNLKRMEIEERIRRVEGVAGAGGWTEKDLEGDFDPDEWDTRMQGVFDETYYNEEDKKKPKFDDIDISDLVPEEMEEEPQEEPQIVEKKPTKREKLDKKRKIEEYLDEHLPLNQPKSSFGYREVSPTTFGLEPVEILTASDAQLNEFVGLKKLAPYRAAEVKEGDKRKYGKKKRLREWRKKVKEEGEDEQIRAMLRPENAEPAAVTEPKEAKKKRKSRKAKVAKV